MELGIKSKRAIVTGSTAGIGLAIAVSLAREGANVVVNGRSQSRVDEAIRELKKDVPGAEVTGIACDMGTASGAEALIKAVPDADILVNNVGIFEPKAFEKIPDEDWMRFFEVNVMSGVRLSRHYLPACSRKTGGESSSSPANPQCRLPPEMIHYGMTKTAQLAIARGLAELTAGSGVTVNSVLPGPTASEGVGTFVDDMAKHRNVDRVKVEKEFFESVRPSSLIKRFATVEEVAAMATYVCSAAASATNGAALRVDGGVVKSIV